MKYVCELCGMIYDEELGDPRHQIPAGTRFEDLPADYECPGCYSEREAFSPCRPRPRTVRPASTSTVATYDGAKLVSER